MREAFERLGTLIMAVLLGIVIVSRSLPFVREGWQTPTNFGEIYAGNVSFYLSLTLLLLAALRFFVIRWQERYVTSVVFCVPFFAIWFFPVQNLSLDVSSINSTTSIDRLFYNINRSVSETDVALLRTDKSSLKTSLLDVSRLDGNAILPNFVYPDLTLLERIFEGWNSRGSQSTDGALDAVPKETQEIIELRAQIAFYEENWTDFEKCLRWYAENAEVFSDDRGTCSQLLQQAPKAIADTKDELNAAVARLNDEFTGQLFAASQIQFHARLADMTRSKILDWQNSFIFSSSLLGCIIALCIFTSYGTLILSYSTISSVSIFAILNLSSFEDQGLSLGTSSFAFSLLCSSVIIICCLVARYFVIHNKGVGRLFNFSEWVPIIAASAFKYSILGGVAVSGAYASASFVTNARDLVYKLEISPDYSFGSARTDHLYEARLCDGNSKFLIYPALSKPNVERDVDNAIRCHFLNTISTVQGADVSGAVAQNKEKVMEIAGELFDTVIPKSLPCSAGGKPRDHCITEALNYPHCSLLQFICKIKRLPERWADNTYFSWRKGFRRDYINRVESMVESAQQGAEVGESDLKPILINGLYDASLQVREAISTPFRMFDFANYLGGLLFFVALIKSMGYVFGRVLFDEIAAKGIVFPDDSAFLTPPKSVFGSLEARQIDQPGLYYSRKDVNITEVAPTWPWIWRLHRLTISRFPSLLLLARFRVELPEEEGSSPDVLKSPVIARVEPQDFIKFELSDDIDCGLAFSISKFYACSKDVKLRRVWSFSLSHLVLGRASMAVASGNGYLILRSTGKIRDGSVGSGSDEKFDPTRLIAWAPNQSVRVHSKASFESVYMGGITITCPSSSVTLYDVSRDRAGFIGALKFVPMLLLPI